MKQIIYAMQFKGKAGPGPSANVMKAVTSASSTTITTEIGAEAIHGTIKAAQGGKAEFESEVTLTGETAFLEKGTIRFGDGNRLQFSTVEHGYLGDSADPKLKSGAVMWRVDGGEGRQFAGATGFITSNFTLSDAGDITDNQFGVIFVK